MSAQLDIQVAESRPLETGRIPVLVSVLNSELETVVGPVPFVPSEGTAIQVDPGIYVVHLDTPSGQRLSKAVDARESPNQLVSFDLHALSGHEALEKTALLKPFDSQEQSPGLDAAGFRSAWIRLWKRQTSGQWLLSPFTPLATDHNRDGVRYDFSLPMFPHTLQIGGPQTKWRLFALPVQESVTVTIAPDHARHGEVITTAITGNDVAESLLGYLGLGLTAHAEALWPMAEDLLQHKFRDPIGAAVGGYFLLRLRRLGRLREWAANLADNFGWLPDGAIIDGWLHLHMARQNNDDDEYTLVRDRFLDAASRGLPLYTEGLRLLVDGLTLFADSAEVRNALEGVRRYADCVDWAATTVTFRGHDPDRPDMVPQLGVPDSTAGMVFLQNLSLADIVQAGFLAPGTTVQLRGTGVEGVITPNGELQLDTGQTYSDPDAAAAEMLTTTAPQIRWHDWTVGASKTLAMIADEARSTSIQAEPSDPIERLGLAALTIWTLKRAGITRVRDVTRSYDRLGSVNGVGQRSITEITRALAASDLSPTTSPPDLTMSQSNLPDQPADLARRDETLAVNSHVRTVELKADGSVVLTVHVFSFGAGRSVEISGYITQNSGAFAPFSTNQSVPAPVAGVSSVTVNVPAMGLNPGEDVEVITRVAEAQIWPTVLRAEVAEQNVKATWRSKNDIPAVHEQLESRSGDRPTPAAAESPIPASGSQLRGSSVTVKGLQQGTKYHITVEVASDEPWSTNQ
jgi:hypothetical protein